ncbi:MAG: hypothetical protein U5J98_02010 [Halobacteriales archaeon]|nr:hypothetical protein [Halobacteriales archaeon]
MPASDAAPALHEWPGGLTWLARPDEPMQRASHALGDGDDVWLVDPLDADGIDATIDGLGEVAGVVVLLDRHTRDAAAFADRHDVAVHVPELLTDAADGLGAPVERFADELGDTGYRVRPVVANRFWREAALVGDDGGSLIVPEALGTNPFVRAPGEAVGVHPVLRPVPPRRQLGDLAPDRLLVGHGAPVLDGAAPAISDALAGARRRAPAAYWGTLRALLGR